MRAWLFLTLCCIVCSAEQIVNMNGDYLISNQDPNAPSSWSSSYSKFEDVEFFDVYSPPISSAQRVWFFNIGSGQVWDKIPGSGSGSGRVGVSKNTIGYFRVSFLLSGISGYVGYFRVFLGLPIYTRVI